ncbi:hypothetical protein D3C79_776400 [compost metagenome]
MAGIELLGEDAVPAGAHRIGRARQAAHQRAVGQPGQGARLHGGGADVGHGNLPEQLTKAFYLLVQQAGHGLGRAVAAGKAGAAGDQHYLHAVIGDPGGDLGADLVQVVFQQHALGQAVAGCVQAVDEQLAGGIGVEGTGVADREHGDVQRHEGGICLGFHGGPSQEDGMAAVITQHAPITA